MGLLDFLNTPQGQALASGVATYAATARRGTPINNIGRGLMGGVQGYSGAIEAQRQAAQDEQRNEYNRKQQELLGFSYDTQRMAAEEKRREMERKRNALKSEGKQALNFYAKAFPDRKFNVTYEDDGEYQIVPVAGSIGMNDDGSYANQLNPTAIDQATGYNQQNNSLPGGYTPQLPPKKMYNENIAKFYGFNDEQMLGLRDVMEGMPDVAPAHLKDAFRANLKARYGKTGGGGLTNLQEGEDGRMYGYDKETNSMIPVSGQFKPKEKKGISVAVHNYGEPKAVQMADGSQGLVRFGKNPNDPPVIVPFSPPASDTEQMAAGYADRMKESDSVIKNIGTPGNPTLTTSIVGSLGDYPQRLVMTKEQQMHRQAQEDWVRAKLRKESGAVIADEEMEREINVYFPKPGDTKEVIAQKERARAQAVQSMYKTAGPAAQKQQAKPNFSVVAPNGKTYSFPDANSLANFKKSAGIK